MKAICCHHCSQESEIHYERDDDLFDEPIFCPFCGKPTSEAELLLEEELEELDEWEN